MENPIFLSKRTGEPFVYYHTHSVKTDNLQEAIESKKSIELDIAIDKKGVFYKKGSCYIGHPVSFYTEAKEEEFHNNLELEEVITRLENNKDIFVMFDCKSVEAIPKIETFVSRLGKDRCLFHAYATEWGIDSKDDKFKYQSYWSEEDMLLSEILDFKKRTNVPIIVAARALTEDRLREKDLVNKILVEAKGKDIDCISLYMQDTILPPLDLARQISKAGFLNWINIDKIEGVDLTGITYIGMTDVLNKASDYIKN